MDIEIRPTALDEVKLIVPQVAADPRGFFLEVFRADVFADAGLPTVFKQLNHSRSARNVVRGLHFQYDPPMGKLMRVTAGEAFVVAVDLRPESQTLGQWVGHVLSEENKIQMWAPPQYARGFCALSDVVDVQYLCTATYAPATESGILWNDPEIGIKWPASRPTLSKKDAEAQTLAQWLSRPESRAFSSAPGGGNAAR